MANESFSENLLKAIFAHTIFQSGLLAAQQMYGKSYFSLGVGEKAVVDQTVFQMAAGNFQSITPEGLASPKASEPMGFRTQAETKT